MSLINNVLDYSKIESGTMELILEDTDMVRLLNEVITILQNEIEAKGISIIVPPFENKEIVRGDKIRLRQVLINIIGNAIKFSPKGSIEIDMGLVTQEEILSMKKSPHIYSNQYGYNI